MANVSIKLPDDLHAAVHAWWQANYSDYRKISYAVVALIGYGLARPYEVKCDLSRDHIASQDLRQCRGSTFSLPRPTRAAIEAHRACYGLPSRAEAVRELLRLGLGLPQPTVTHIPLGSGRRSPESDRRRKMILDQWASGVSMRRIAQSVAISRQRVFRILKDAGCA